jgi:hypothetical protein
MKRYWFPISLVLVGGAALLYAVAMLYLAWSPLPIEGVPPERFTPKQKGPLLEDAIRAMGDDPANALEP